VTAAAQAPTPRRAQASDADEVDRLYAQLVDDPRLEVLPQRLAELQRSPTAALLVVDDERDDGHGLLGTVFVVLCPDAMFGRQPFAVVENIVVDARARGQGVGALLLAEAERFCLAADCSKIMLLSATEREGAHRFFERAGYAADRKRGFVKYRHQFGG
jgi:GNAT superfamily N-acetyltransferase